MDCRNIQRLLPAYQDKELTGAQVREIEDHLLTCTACRDMKSAVSESWSNLGAWEDSEVPRRARESLMSCVSRQRKMLWIKIALPVAATLVIIFGLTIRYMGYRNEGRIQVPLASTDQMSTEHADVDEDELIADLHILQDEEFFDAVEELVSIDYLPLVEEPSQTETDEQRSSLPVIVT